MIAKSRLWLDISALNHPHPPPHRPHHRPPHRHYHHHHQSRHLCIKSASRQTFAHAITRSSRQAFVQFHKKEQICIFENVLKMF